MKQLRTERPLPNYGDVPAIGADTLLKSGLKLTHMRMIVALDDHGQVSAAANVLGMSQPAASRMIAEMESILKAPLCERLSRGMGLTQYGRALARRARAILLELREVDREISELRSGRGGTVLLGCVTAPAIELAVPAIRRMREENPGLQVSIQVESSPVLTRELLASRHDFIIARVPDDLNPRLFEIQEIGVEKACLIVRRGHPLMGAEEVDPERLVEFDWVFQPEGSLLRRTVERILISRNVPLPERVLNTGSLLLTLVMVAQSDAIAPVSVEVAKFIGGEHGLAGAIEVLPLDFDIDVQPYSLIKVRNRVLSPAAAALYAKILSQIGRPPE
ncbi:LysR family transcriptional regulator [Pseudaminobacter sp. 19-2017]|uniref:LysR family transcriptional regulator n=1 Tax=Pseudaminobacter soli (ex Zhang et al. 2022) TaxID=2831468 RepID=A0A942E6G2_9HYPH|nr:LysR family transcriptional regulator [Pseudaminobacter soli]MBS3652150.1 LysR family transcriptional regulator [Pseudaminobacter soli]